MLTSRKSIKPLRRRGWAFRRIRLHSSTCLRSECRLKEPLLPFPTHRVFIKVSFAYDAMHAIMQSDRADPLSRFNQIGEPTAAGNKRIGRRGGSEVARCETSRLCGVLSIPTPKIIHQCGPPVPAAGRGDTMPGLCPAKPLGVKGRIVALNGDHVALISRTKGLVGRNIIFRAV